MAKRGKHTSARGVFQHSVVWLEGLDGIKKVILGPHHPCHHSLAPGAVIFAQNTKTGIKVRGYTDGGIRDIFLILKSLEHRDKIKRAIKRKFPQ